MKKLISIFLVLFILTGFLGLFGNNSYAQSEPLGYNLSFQPTILAVKVKPGDTTKTDISITNKNNTPLSFNISIENFKAANGGSYVTFYKDKGIYDLSQWVKPEENSVKLSAQEQQYETLDISIPSGIIPGTYTGVILMTTVSTSPFASGSSIVARAGINLIINVASSESSYISAIKPVILENISIPFFNFVYPTVTGDIKNLGSFADSENITIETKPIWIFGSDKKFTYKEIDVLPGQYRYLDGENSGIKLNGVNTGIYQMILTVHDNITGKSQTHVAYFTLNIYLYILVMLLCVVILMALIIIIKNALRRTKHRQ